MWSKEKRKKLEQVNKDIEPLANPEIAQYYLKGVDLYRRIKPLQDSFAAAIESNNFKEANESSEEIIQTVQEFHTLFYHRPTYLPRGQNKGIIKWQSAEKIQLRVRKLNTLLMDIDRAAKNIDVSNFVKSVDSAYISMYGILEHAKECAEEGIPIPRRRIDREKWDGHELQPWYEKHTGKYADPRVVEQDNIIKKYMKRIYSQRAKLDQWKEFTKHHRRSQDETESELEPLPNKPTQELSTLLQEFEEEM